MRRKVIMHVGPTNSGKTHMALRALAAARVGVYAGPLRLLAHEIWERLNKGQIVPLGVDPDDEAQPDTTLIADVVNTEGSRPTVRKEGSSKYARECNLRTGEEARYVSDSAGLLSCTVEMITESAELDVAVVDEIQMIADTDRGAAWTHAVLGLPARELHLCGEETAVPIIEELLKDTGDELIVKRYERLTPLVVQEESLEGDLNRVQKGDCVVTFSRSNIFALKQKVERATGLRCAVAYGRLPPEIRSEQAALFNDPNSGYDVMIGSDAIGMGLNLKIKRIVFEALRKFDGDRERMLSTSQIKQIAGRAGRYGLHGEPGGFVTTLNADDLPALRSALSMPADPLTMARLVIKSSWLDSVSQVLPPDASLLTIFEVPGYVSKVRQPFQATTQHRLDEMAKFVDTFANDLTFEDKLLYMSAPISWSDPAFLEVLKRFVRMYQSQIRVDIYTALRSAPFLPMLTEIEELMSTGQLRFSPSPKTLPTLETLHKVLVLYMWLGNRNGMAYYQRDEVYDLKVRTEHALEWCLEKLSKLRYKRESGFAKTEVENKIDYRNGPKSSVESDAKRMRAMLLAEALVEKSGAISQ
ncbi:hypothetical protein SERLA73DRAFT_186151 [Serpula lacrymans var. lacrymans S7.3]|uniref:Helicase C-terminal domain-containing protein n=2 Tax=Serpula lacrymans var. lacrymans TaxID=341189 RepID=F8Q5D9_SERL3|nr:uncharacterized protein SERLADRAFT_475024 [Serpula lacrymans var. lacrymans S7.9]EGN96410.1 hypothetical protein SERLA73DRAFT_186151 [Serpula lacrymans var. lacrymans S7.3]EGO21950.1 hypothetical protein SERLADRAFT_475024 [Serpula lacrymans var. lacrymans S7.9]